MIGMFEAVDELGSWSTRHYPLADIESVGSCAPGRAVKGEWWSVRRRENKSSVYLSESMWQNLMRHPVQIMPIDPSYSLIRFGCDGDGPWSFADHVLAWALCWDGEMRPITRDGVDGGLPFFDPVYIRMPDGTMEAGPHCDRIDSLEEGLKSAQRDWEAANTRKAEA
jgi:hypothetical protein